MERSKCNHDETWLCDLCLPNDRWDLFKSAECDFQKQEVAKRLVFLFESKDDVDLLYAICDRIDKQKEAQRLHDCSFIEHRTHTDHEENISEECDYCMCEEGCSYIDWDEKDSKYDPAYLADLESKRDAMLARATKACG